MRGAWPGREMVIPEHTALKTKRVSRSRGSISWVATSKANHYEVSLFKFSG